MPDEKKAPTLSDVVKPVEPAAPKAEAKPESTVPDAYQGKTMEEVIAMAEQRDKSYNELRALQSRQANELGEVRRMADQLIQADIGKKDTGTKEASIDLDSFDDPKAATDAIAALIDRKVQEKLGGVEAKVGQLTGLSIEQRLNNDHPEWRSTIMSEEYTKWVAESPVRQRLAAEGNAGDYDAGHELLSTFEALHKTAATDTADADEAAKEEALKSATLESSGTARRSDNAKPVYRRADIMALRINDPDQYDSMRPEIRQAFAEGRVK